MNSLLLKHHNVKPSRNYYSLTFFMIHEKWELESTGKVLIIFLKFFLFTGKEVQKKWSSLRDSFRRELSQQKKTPSGSAAKKRRKYIYFDQLLFLVPFTQITQTSSSLDDAEERETQSQLLPLNTEQSQNEQPQRTLGAEQLPSTSTYNRKKSKINYDEEILKVLKEGNKGLKESNTRVLDEDESFLMSLLPPFKKYDQENKFLLRIAFMNTIIEFDRNHREGANPGTAYQNPGTPYQNPGTSYQNPGTPYENPGTSYQNPGPLYQNSRAPYQNPDNRYQYQTGRPGSFTNGQTNFETNSFPLQLNDFRTNTFQNGRRQTVDPPIQSPDSYISGQEESDLLSLGTEEENVVSPESVA